MRKLIYFSLISISLCSCKAFKPSANLSDFESYFAEEKLDSIQKNAIKVTFFGTSTLLFDDGENQIIIDGFFSRPPVGKVAFGKVKSDESLIRQIIEKHSIKTLKGIFVCHSHYDHAMDAPLLSQLTGAKIYGSSSTLNLGKGEKVSETNMELFEPGKRINIGDFQITVINSKHTPPFKLLGKSNATAPNHPNIDEPLQQPAKVDHYIEGGTYDIYIECNGKRFLVKASTNYIEGGLKNYPCDVFFLGTAMLGIQPNDFQENYYNETISATRAKTVIPIHWDNFMHPISKPLIALPNISDNVTAGFNFLLNKTKADNIKLQLLQGETSVVF